MAKGFLEDWPEPEPVLYDIYMVKNLPLGEEAPGALYDSNKKGLGYSLTAAHVRIADLENMNMGVRFTKRLRGFQEIAPVESSGPYEDYGDPDIGNSRNILPTILPEDPEVSLEELEEMSSSDDEDECF